MCPCPRCTISKKEISKLGSSEDRQKRQSSARVDDPRRRDNIVKARHLIYKENARVNSVAVERILKEASLVPNQVSSWTKFAPVLSCSYLLPKNAFSNKLSHLGFNYFQMLAVDLLHEFELGVWKALFTHLLRILAAINPDLLNELDRRWVFLSKVGTYLRCTEVNWERYRQIPSFGKGTIRKFSANTSQMKKLAARDFEDILQVSYLCRSILQFEISHCLTSVHSLCSMDCSLEIIILQLCVYCLFVLIGMGLLNFECTLTQHLSS